MRRSFRRTVALAAVGGVLVGCGSADDTDTAAPDDGSASVELEAPDDTSGLTDDPAGDDDSGTPTTSDDATDAAADDEPAATDADGAGGQDIDPATQHPVTADPGRWVVADAGYVEWDLTDNGLQLVNVEQAEGWSSQVDDEGSDEIEVDFQRDNTEVHFEVERNGSGVEVEIQTDMEPADAGSYELGQAGSFEFAADGGLSLQDVAAADGWDLQIDDESSDEIEFTLTSGDERWKVDIDYDDGEVELQIDYRVRTN